MILFYMMHLLLVSRCDESYLCCVISIYLKSVSFFGFFRRFLSIWPLFEANSGFLSIFLAFCLEYVSHLVDWSKLEKRSRLGSRSRGAPHWTISLKSGTPFNTVYRSVWIQAELKYLEDYEILLIVRSDQKILICYTYMVRLTEIRLLNQYLC